MVNVASLTQVEIGKTIDHVFGQSYKNLPTTNPHVPPTSFGPLHFFPVVERRVFSGGFASWDVINPPSKIVSLVTERGALWTWLERRELLSNKIQSFLAKRAPLGIYWQKCHVSATRTLPEGCHLKGTKISRYTRTLLDLLCYCHSNRYQYLTADLAYANYDVLSSSLVDGSYIIVSSNL